MSSVFTKTVAVDWTGGVSAADVPSLAVIGVLATAGMLLSQASYRGAGLAAPLATLTVVNPVVAAAVGITMFGETFRYGTTGTALALSCGVVAAGGLILLTTERLTHGQPVHGAPEPVAATEPAAVPEPVAATEPTDVSEPVAAPWPVDVFEPVAAPWPAAVSDPVAAVAEAVAAGGRAVAEDVFVPGPGPRPGSAAVLVPGPETPLAVLVPEPDAPVAVLVPGPGAAAPGADAAYESGEPSVVAADDERPLSYVPFYGIPYVPLPTVDRHRIRVRS
jgi:hypothetical protein